MTSITISTTTKQSQYLPADDAPRTFDNFDSIEAERVIRFRNARQKVPLGQHSVLKEVIWAEVEYEVKAHRLELIIDRDVLQVTQDLLVLGAHHFLQYVNFVEYCQPEIGNTWR